MCICVCVYIYIYVCVCVRACVCARARACVRVWFVSVDRYMRMSPCMFRGSCICRLAFYRELLMLMLGGCLSLCVYIRIDMCIHAFAQMCICQCVCIHTHAETYTYAAVGMQHTTRTAVVRIRTCHMCGRSCVCDWQCR
jgi:hypothetical protein